MYIHGFNNDSDDSALDRLVDAHSPSSKALGVIGTKLKKHRA